MKSDRLDIRITAPEKTLLKRAALKSKISMARLVKDASLAFAKGIVGK